MSCIITYKGKKYSEEQFKEYFINNKQEFATSIAKNKGVVDSFKRKMEGIDFVFSQSPELASIGNKAQYLQYLSTIFKTSKVKDIVYHGTRTKEEFEKFITEREYPIQLPHLKGKISKGSFFTKDKNIADVVGIRTITAILNMKNPLYRNKGSEYLFKEDVEDIQKNNDSLIAPGNKEEFIVFEPEQIHVLSSKADIQGFKNFVQGKQFQKLTAEEKAKTIEQVTKEHRSIAALKDLAAKLAHRIGGKVKFENNPNADWKGYNQGMESVLNEAYMDESTAFHEIMGHPIIRAIKYNGKYNRDAELERYNNMMNDYWDKHPNKSREEVGLYMKNNFKELKISELYQSLLKELETGRGKEVFEQVKRDYKLKGGDSNFAENFTGDYKEKFIKENSYTLEEQQEEAIVTLLGLMAADKLDAKKDANLISKLKELWKQISDFVKSLLRQDGIKIDELPITTTLNDLAEIMAYGNNKIILPGYKVEYNTPLGNKYDTLEEVNNEIRGLADADVEVDLSNVKVNTTPFTNEESLELDYLQELSGEKSITEEQEKRRIELLNKSYNQLLSFIEKNKEYEQSKEIIEQWKKDNNIQYDPEEVYSRGQEFYHIKDAYFDSAKDTELWVQGLLGILDDYERAGTRMELSFATAPQGEVGKGMRGMPEARRNGTLVYITAYPQSEDIVMASKVDNNTSSFGHLNGLEKTFTNRDNTVTGIALTKSVPLYNLNTIEPNLADTIDDVAHHNESVIALTKNNFRIHYGENVAYEVKHIIDKFNKILDDKYGKLEKPEIKKPKDKIQQVTAESFEEVNQLKEEGWIEIGKSEEGFPLFQKENTNNIAKQPTQTRENTTSIDSVKKKLGIYGGKRDFNTYTELIKGSIVTVEGHAGEYYIESTSDSDGEIGVGVTNLFYDLYPINEFDPETNPNGQHPLFNVPEKVIKLKENKQKEYTEQALINTKIAKLKEVAKKYPRSLITSKVVPINPNMVYNSEIQYSKVGSKQDVEGFKEILARVGNPILAEIEFDEMTEPEDINEISLYLSRQIHDKFGVKIGPLLPNMLDLLNNQPVINQEDVDNKKLEC